MTDYSDLMITPLVEGYKPWQINIFTLGSGGKQEAEFDVPEEVEITLEELEDGAEFEYIIE